MLKQPMVSKRKKIREWLAHYITEKVELCIVKESVMAKKTNNYVNITSFNLILFVKYYKIFKNT
ncbi:MAG TPA: hypothetical protein DER05_06025 [Lutibacter sp.]|nr:hypothetical protein [Lutibacter sp.]